MNTTSKTIEATKEPISLPSKFESFIRKNILEDFEAFGYEDIFLRSCLENYNSLYTERHSITETTVYNLDQFFSLFKTTDDLLKRMTLGDLAWVRVSDILEFFSKESVHYLNRFEKAVLAYSIFNFLPEYSPQIMIAVLRVAFCNNRQESNVTVGEVFLSILNKIQDNYPVEWIIDSEGLTDVVEKSDILLLTNLIY